VSLKKTELLELVDGINQNGSERTSEYNYV